MLSLKEVTLEERIPLIASAIHWYWNNTTYYPMLCDKAKKMRMLSKLYNIKERDNHTMMTEKITNKLNKLSFIGANVFSKTYSPEIIDLNETKQTTEARWAEYKKRDELAKERENFRKRQEFHKKLDENQEELLKECEEVKRHNNVPEHLRSKLTIKITDIKWEWRTIKRAQKIFQKEEYWGAIPKEDKDIGEIWFYDGTYKLTKEERLYYDDLHYGDEDEKEFQLYKKEKEYRIERLLYTKEHGWKPYKQREQIVLKQMEKEKDPLKRQRKIASQPPQRKPQQVSWDDNVNERYFINIQKLNQEWF